MKKEGIELMKEIIGDAIKSQPVSQFYNYRRRLEGEQLVINPFGRRLAADSTVKTKNALLSNNTLIK